MARSKDEVIFFSFRMSLTNPQHLKIAKALKKVDLDKHKSKNQFIADAIEYYLDNQDRDNQKEEQKFITRKDIEEIKRELREEMVAIARVELMRPYNALAMASGISVQQTPVQQKTAELDEVISELVSDWD